MKLVVHGGVKVGSDQGVESRCVGGVEPEPPAGVTNRAESKSSKGSNNNGTRVARQRWVADSSLAIPPSGIGAFESPVIPVPHGEALDIQPGQERFSSDPAVVAIIEPEPQFCESGHG